MTAGERDKFGWLLEVVQQHFKGKKASLTPADIKPGCIYVLDWRPDEPENVGSITVEHVEKVESQDNPFFDIFEAGGDVALVGSEAAGRSRIFLSDMVELAVGGPFPVKPGFVQKTNCPPDVAPKGEQS